MRKLRVIFPLNLNDKDEALRGEVYWEEFKTSSIEAFDKSILEAIRLCKFFPKPHELWEFIDEFNRIKYSESIPREEFRQIEYVKTEEEIQEEKEVAKKCLIDLKEKLFQKNILSPVLLGEKAEEFERKRSLAKEKLKQLN